MFIERLSYKTLDDAIDLLDRTFPNQGSDSVRDSLQASLNPEKYKDYLAKNHMNGNNYWVLKNDSREVMGVTGLHYCDFDKDEAVWGGWTAIHPKLRRRLSLAGYILFKHVYSEAKKTNRPYFRFYMFEDGEGGIAQKIFQLAGFKEFKRETDTYGVRKILFQKKF